jgi:hypothetical protein
MYIFGDKIPLDRYKRSRPVKIRVKLYTVIHPTLQFSGGNGKLAHPSL